MKRLISVLTLIALPFIGFSSEADLIVPDLSKSYFPSLGLHGDTLLWLGFVIILLGILFGIFQYLKVKKLPVHPSMANVSHIIYETCKTYLLQQGKFLLILFLIVGAAISYYFFGLVKLEIPKVMLILLWTILGIAGSYTVAWFGIRINTVANSRTSFAALRNRPWDIVNIPLRSGMSVGVLLVCVELVMMLLILLVVPGDSAGACFCRFCHW